MIPFNDYAYVSMTLNDALKIDENFLEDLTLSTTEQTNKLIEMFKSKWDIYEIAGETLEFSKRLIKDKWYTIKDYYQELINDYENKINYLKGYVSTTTITKDDEETYKFGRKVESSNIDLPNKTTSGTYVSSKNIVENSNSDVVNRDNVETITKDGDVNILEQKMKYQKYLRNVYLECVEQFKDCFAQIYG